VRLTKIDTFEGDFELLPLRAHFLFGRLPQCPSDADFHMAVTDAIPAQDPAAEWRVEAIRFRRQNPGARLDDINLKTIARATAARLHRRRFNE